MNTRNWKFIKSILLVSFLLLLLAPAGCIFSPEDTPPGTDEPPIEVRQKATTEDKLMENFQDIYSEMHLDDFKDMLHADYKTILLDGTIDDWDWADGATFDRDDEISIHDHMFNGSAGTDHEGNGINPLDRIEVSLFERIGEWATVDINDVDFPETRRALYEVKIFFHDNTGTHAFAVDQQVIFYAQPVDENGTTIYKLGGQKGLDG